MLSFGKFTLAFLLFPILLLVFRLFPVFILFTVFRLFPVFVLFLVLFRLFPVFRLFLMFPVLFRLFLVFPVLFRLFPFPFTVSLPKLLRLFLFSEVFMAEFKSFLLSITFFVMTRFLEILIGSAIFKCLNLFPMAVIKSPLVFLSTSSSFTLRASLFISLNFVDESKSFSKSLTDKGDLRSVMYVFSLFNIRGGRGNFSSCIFLYT